MSQPETIRLLRIFVSSPSDLLAERQVVDEVVDAFNHREAERLGCRLEAFRWEDDCAPIQGDGPQHAVDQQTPKYDIYLGMMAGRYGTPTGRYGSGTVKEYHDAKARQEKEKKPVILFYFKDGLPAPSTLEEGRQYQSVLEFREQLAQTGLLVKFQRARGGRDALFERLERDLGLVIPDLIARCKEEEAETKRQLHGEEEPTEAEARADLIGNARSQIFDVISPCYLLDANFFFLDWNIAFEEFIAKPLGLTLGDHGLDFVSRLANCEEVIEHSKATFGYGKANPPVDLEVLQIRTPAYGLMHLQKIASQIIDEDGTPVAWVVNLNFIKAENDAQLGKDFAATLQERLDWSRYAISYDRLLVPFDDYNQLVDRVVRLVGPARRCVDLGAGTGNCALRMLDSDPAREVWAVDASDSMLRFLRKKLRSRSPQGSGYAERLITLRDDILSLRTLANKSETFDAAILVNVLYAVHDPVACLRQAHRLLRPGGVLVVSTPHSETDVDALFARMRVVLERKRVFSNLRSNFDDAREIHQRMIGRIHRDKKEDIRRYVTEAGFRIDSWSPDEYVGAVVLLRAIKEETSTNATAPAASAPSPVPAP